MSPSLGHLPCLFNFPDDPFKVPDYPILTKDEVRHVGDAVAFVVADTVEAGARCRRSARDRLAAAAVGDRRQRRGEAGRSAGLAGLSRATCCYDKTIGDKAKVDAVFAKAHAIAEVKIVNQRLVTNYMETRGVVVEYDAKRDHITVTLGSQGSHRQRDLLCQILRLAAGKGARHHARRRRRFRHQDLSVSRIFPRRVRRAKAEEECEVGRRPRRSLPRRRHGRDNVTHARMALDADGKFLAMDVDMLADMGAYLSMFGPYIPYGGAGMLPGLYDIPAFHCRVRAMFTNSVPVDAYRGAGRPEAAYVIERLVDACARKLDMTPDAVRKKNFIPPKAMPYTTATGKVYDSGEFAAHLKLAQDNIDWKGFRQAREGREEERLHPRHRHGLLCRDLRRASGRRPPSSSSARTATSPC